MPKLKTNSGAAKRFKRTANVASLRAPDIKKLSIKPRATVAHETMYFVLRPKALSKPVNMLTVTVARKSVSSVPCGSPASTPPRVNVVCLTAA